MEIRIPEVGESVREALLAKWFKKDGAKVLKDEPLCEIETDKITLDIQADAAGTLSIQVSEGTTVRIGAVVGTISDSDSLSQNDSVPAPDADAGLSAKQTANDAATSPAVRREMRELNIDSGSIDGTGRSGRITLDDLFSRIEETARRNPDASTDDRKMPDISAAQPLQAGFAASDAPSSSQTSVVDAPVMPADAGGVSHTSSSREDRRSMSPIRRRISERMLAARHQTAMLTTFNEADMSRVKSLRERYSRHFQQRHNLHLGYMPFFVKACCEALREFPSVNASIDGDDLVYHKYYDIGVAIGTEKGVVVPILRDADRMRFHEVEKAIEGYAEKIRNNGISISDIDGGTFTISNGGVYGSMLSTPILNPPQSGVLGMHAIQDRPVVRDGQIVIRPMMYLALSYDHRIMDGREAVGFLKKVIEFVEDPEELLLEA